MSRKYYPVIGLEIHAELKTRTKMFCNSKNDTEEKRPNVNTCPVCMGHPGTLPVPNKEAIKHVLKIGLAVGGELADYSEFDRKNYFYPDIPKGYQISQYKYPLVKGGELSGVKLTRVHLEEDTASSIHLSSPRNVAATSAETIPRDSAFSLRESASLIDFNRAGVPLMELVTEPVISSAEQAVAFAKELQLLLRYLGVADADMEKGGMRVEANISVSADKNKFGTKVEVKNLNSFRSVERAIKFEIERHTEALDSGEVIVQETRGWDEAGQRTFLQRKKEASHDYRYFPDPDIPKFRIKEMPEFSEDMLSKELPELPADKRKRLVENYGLGFEEVEQYVQDRDLAEFFEKVVEKISDKKNIKLASNYIISDLAGLMKKVTGENVLKIRPNDYAELIKMISADELSSRGAKEILSIMFEKGGSPKAIAEEKNLIQKSDAGELKTIVAKVIGANTKVVADYKSGKETALQYLVGQCMKESKGSANPEVVKKLLAEELKK